MTLFASFATPADAERAAAALLDRGARKEDLSIVSHESGAVSVGHGEGHEEDVAKHGVTTTTGADAAYGAAKGLTFGAGLGILGAIAALLIPGVGVVVGAGALATAIAGTAAAGAATGGLVGYLKDQGMGADVAARYHARIEAGGAILALALPTGDLDERIAESLLTKYHAEGVFTSYPGVTQDHVVPHVVPSEPLEAGYALPPTIGAEVPVAAVTPTRSDPATGLALEGYVEDPASGIRRNVRFEHGRAFYTA